MCAVGSSRGQATQPCGLKVQVVAALLTRLNKDKDFGLFALGSWIE